MREQMTVRAVLWDVDGTLILSEPIHLQALRDTAATHGIELPDSFHAEMIGRTASYTFRLIQERHHFTEPFESWIERKYRRFIALAGTLRPRPGALQNFNALRRDGVPQALVSNSDRIVVETNMRAMDLVVPKLVSVTLNDVRNGKPDPEPYLRAAHLLGVEPHSCVVVEDSAPGAMAGLRAGMTVLAWPELPGTTFPDGVTLIDDITQGLRALGLPVG